METSKILNSPKMNIVKNKEKLADKIDSLWDQSSSNSKKPKMGTKKLQIKLETNGFEKRKIMLKMESESSIVHSSNYNLISDLLREFFNHSTPLE